MCSARVLAFSNIVGIFEGADIAGSKDTPNTFALIVAMLAFEHILDPAVILGQRDFVRTVAVHSIPFFVARITSVRVGERLEDGFKLLVISLCRKIDNGETK